MIPKTIHYCWFGGKKLPKDVRQCIKSWKKYCPDYNIVQWNEKNFNVNENKFTKAAYEDKGWAFVSDYARLKIIYDNGGIYLDTDVELIKNLDSLLNNECYVAVQKHDHVIATGLGFGAEKGHSMIANMLLEYDTIMYDEMNKENFTCPKLNTLAFVKKGYEYSDDVTCVQGVMIYPGRFFDPYSTGEKDSSLCEDTYSIHHYSASWTKGSHRLKRRIARVIGEKNVFRIKKIFRK